MAAKRPAVWRTLCRVCNDRKGTITCPVCSEKHCDSESCRKDDPSCKTCSDCYHNNCKPCGTFIDPRERIEREIKTVDLTITAVEKRLSELKKDRELLTYRLQSHERRLGKLK